MRVNELFEVSANPDYLRAAERSLGQAIATQRTFGKSPEEKAAARRTELKREKGMQGYGRRHRAANPEMYPEIKPRPAAKLRDPSTEYSDDYSVWSAGRRDTMEQGVAEGLDDNGISFQVQKGKNKFATTLSVGGDPVGVYQYDANTGRSIAEIYPEFKGKGLGKLLVLHAIYTAANLGLDFQEDESRTSEYDNVLDSLSSNGYIVDDDGYWYVTGQGEQYLQQSLKQGVAEGAENLSYIGNCTDDDVIEHIFGDATGFAQAVDEYGDEFTLDDLVVKYDPETDVHSFYYKEQGMAEGRTK
jgi:GNAT superfamily N-acetyltransferase